MEKFLNVRGMHCKSCEIILDDSISEIKGVEKVKSDFKNGKISVIFSDDSVLEEVKKIIKKEGYQVE